MDPYMAGARYQRLMRCREASSWAEGACRSRFDTRERMQGPLRAFRDLGSPEAVASVARAPGSDPDAMFAERPECLYTCAGLRQRSAAEPRFSSHCCCWPASPVSSQQTLAAQQHTQDMSIRQVNKADDKAIERRRQPAGDAARARARRAALAAAGPASPGPPRRVVDLTPVPLEARAMVKMPPRGEWCICCKFKSKDEGAAPLPPRPPPPPVECRPPWETGGESDDGGGGGDAWTCSGDSDEDRA
eukprot:gene13875-biopygen11690